MRPVTAGSGQETGSGGDCLRHQTGETPRADATCTIGDGISPQINPQTGPAVVKIEPNALGERETTVKLSYLSKLRRENGRSRLAAREAERRAMEIQAAANDRIIRAELKVAALMAGLIDPDAAIFLDHSGITLDAAGELAGIEAAIASLKQSKPFLWRKQ